MANISKIKLPDVISPYDIADKIVRSNVENNTYSFLTYKDNTHTEAQIKALTSAKVGDFYIASDTGTAYVCIKAVTGTASASSWEKAGSSADVSKFVTAYDTTGQIVDPVEQTFSGHTVNEFVLKDNVVDNLTSTSTDVPLSANQGRVLEENINSVNTVANNANTKAEGLETSVNGITSDISSLQSSVQTLNSDNTTNKNNITSLTNNKLNKSGGTMTGILTAQNNTSYTTKQVRNIFISTSSPSGGSNGDIWIKYTG